MTTKLKHVVSLVALVERLKKNELPVGPDAIRFVFNEKAELQVWLAEKSEKTIGELRALGFEVIFDSKAATLVIGRLLINKLEELIDLKTVRYVAPLLK